MMKISILDVLKGSEYTSAFGSNPFCLIPGRVWGGGGGGQCVFFSKPSHPIAFINETSLTLWKLAILFTLSPPFPHFYFKPIPLPHFVNIELNASEKVNVAQGSQSFKAFSKAGIWFCGNQVPFLLILKVVWKFVSK